jgi:hypothetical protein
MVDKESLLGVKQEQVLVREQHLQTKIHTGIVLTIHGQNNY